MEILKSTSPHHLVLVLLGTHLISHFLFFFIFNQYSLSVYIVCYIIGTPHHQIFNFNLIDPHMGSSSMKVHQFTRGLIWEHEPSSLTLSLCKRLRPLAPKIPDTTTTTTTVTPFDLKSFIRPDCGPRKLVSSDQNRESNHQVHIYIYIYAHVQLATF